MTQQLQQQQQMMMQRRVGRQNPTASSKTSTVKKPLDLVSASRLPSVTGATA